VTALLEIGSVVRPHGIRGECIVALVTDRLERLAPGTHLQGELAAPGPGGAAARAGAETAVEAARTELEVLASRPHQGRFIVTFAGVADRDGAERLRGTRLFAEPISDPAAWFVHELIGCEVSDLSGNPLGTVTAVEANPASDLLVLDGRHLVPLRFVVERSAGRLVADPPPGLIE
jgi:16S rRNA processing protein RimM